MEPMETENTCHTDVELHQPSIKQKSKGDENFCNDEIIFRPVTVTVEDIGRYLPLGQTYVSVRQLSREGHNWMNVNCDYSDISQRTSYGLSDSETETDSENIKHCDDDLRKAKLEL